MDNLIRILGLVDRELSEDVRAVLDTAAVLQITEFEVFQQAYRRWYGHDVTDKTIEHFFVAYMFNETVPFWVRHYSRTALSEAHTGNPVDGPTITQEPSPAPYRAVGVALFLGAVLIGLFLLAQASPKLFWCQFPPCY